MSHQQSSPRRSRHETPHRHHRQSPRRRRPSDVEQHAYHTTSAPTTPRRRDRTYSPGSPSSPTTPYRDTDPLAMANPHGHSDFTRKRSLVRPERNRIDKHHPNYHYRKHAKNMEVRPSTTGNDPMMEDGTEGDATTLSSGGTAMRLRNTSRGDYDEEKPGAVVTEAVGAQSKTTGARGTKRRVERRPTRREVQEEKRLRKQDPVGELSLWNIYCAIVTFWCPDAVLRCFGKPQKAQQRAWREKMGLLSIILLICTFVGYLTFGFTQTVCPGGGPVRLRENEVDTGYLIIHGEAYDLSRSHHPIAHGIPSGANVLFDLPEKHGGQDASFLFQNVNGACKGLITANQNSGIPTNDNGDLGWYFPCRTFNQDGSSKPNNTADPYYLGYRCHTGRTAREAFYSLRSSGDVYFTWDDIRNSSRNLMVWGSDVLDLNLINFFNKTQVSYPALFDQLKASPQVKGIDMTRALSGANDITAAKCLSDIIKVGSIDTATIGCIASEVVLYLSLVFILSIVIVKFILALLFQWFLCRKFAPTKTSMSSNSKKRKQQIEDWADDIYRAPPKLLDQPSAVDRSSKRGSTFFPTTSRFTSPYAIDRSKLKHVPTTMASQSSSARQTSSIYRQGNQSQGTFPTGVEQCSVAIMSASGDDYTSAVDSEGPAGFIHEAVVPQPPAEWEPFGYPLAHTICLVTAYSEGHEGLRSTLDSIAMTDYPNSHKLILLICDGMIKGKGEALSTPDIALGMMRDHTVMPDDVQAFSYVAVASGSKRHNMAKVYSGFYDYGEDSRIHGDKQQRVPMVVLVKCGTPDEATNSKPGNRGKRDSQIILMSFLQKVMFDERMTELEFEMFNGIWKITGMSPDFYETVLMVDADTKVFPDSLTHMVSAMVKDPEIMGLCGETKIANKRATWVSMTQVFEYFISHHLSKSFESVFGGVTCLPGCFCMYRIKAPKGGQNYWVPILANPDVVEHYSENVVDTLHKKNLLLLGEDRYLSTLMLKTFPKRKQVFVPQAVCKTTVPEQFRVLLSQRRRWINSTVHNLMELVLVRDLCGTFCFSMQFVVFIELVGTLVLPAAIAFTVYLIAVSIKAGIEHTKAPVIPLVLLALILGLPAVLIVLTAQRWSYVGWMFIYLLSLPLWNFVLPTYAYWKFDDFSWGETRKTAGETTKKAGIEYEGEFDSSKITMKRWGDFEQERRLRAPNAATSSQHSTGGAGWPPAERTTRHGHESYYDN